MENISNELLENYTTLLKSKFRTGVDKITPSNFIINRNKNFEVINKKYSDGSYKFTRLKRINLPSGRIVNIPTSRDRLTIEILKNNLKSKYRIHFINREYIVKTLIGKLKGGTPFHVIRLDIKDFFPSIPHNKLLSKLKNSSLLSFTEYELTKKIIKLSGNKGIPQGLSVSNILSEIYLEDIDSKVKRVHPRINYYCRYVDDILIIINGHLSYREEEEIKRNISRIFSVYGLTLNSEKERYLKLSKDNDGEFDFLGYNFSLEKNKLNVRISKSKIIKVIKVIDKYIHEYENVHRNTNLLIEQLRYITHKKSIFRYTVSLDKNGSLIYSKRKIYFGVIESYKEIGAQNLQWDYFDRYLRGKLLTLKNKCLLRGTVYRSLHRYSFKRNITQNNIYKLNKYKKDQLISLLMTLDSSFKLHTLQGENRIELFSRYFKLVERKL